MGIQSLYCLHLRQTLFITEIYNNCTSTIFSNDDYDTNNDIDDHNEVVGAAAAAIVVAPIIDYAIAFYFEVTFWVATNFVIGLFGTVSNIVNIVVYAKMGIREAVNVSLLGLAVSDLLSVVTVVWMSICYGLLLVDPPGLPFDPMIFMYLTGGWPHFMFSRVTCFITTMVSIERCLCVITPFKVKQIVTPTRIKLCLVFIFIAFPSAYIPALLEHRLAWKYDVIHNETRIMADFTDRQPEVQAKSYYANGLLFPTTSFLIVAISVFITTRSLHRKVEWKMEHRTIGVSSMSNNMKSSDCVEKEIKNGEIRTDYHGFNCKDRDDEESSTNSTDYNKSKNSNKRNDATEYKNSSCNKMTDGFCNEWPKTKSTDGNTNKYNYESKDHGSRNIGASMSMKELKVIRLLTVVCVMFLCCYSPSVVLLYVRVWEPRLNMFKEYHNLSLVCYSLVFLTEISNSSFNIIIYYVMSSKYRATFQSLFSRSRSNL